LGITLRTFVFPVDSQSETARL